MALHAAAAATGRGNAAATVVVLGGGIGGLVTAGRLAKEGCHVVLLEQNAQVTKTAKTPR